MTSSGLVWGFVGSYAPATEPGIHVVALDESRGELHRHAAVDGVANPSFLALEPTGRHLYAVGETGAAEDGRPGSVHAFRIERDRGQPVLVAIGERPSGGDHPCHVQVDPSGRWLAVSNYGTGNVVVFPLLGDGRLGEPVARMQHAGAGPNPDRQRGPHAHSSVFTPDGAGLISADLGTDRLVISRLGRDGSWGPAGEVATRPGAGPRHLAFHPDGVHLFVVNELDNTVALAAWEAEPARVRMLQVTSTVPAGTGSNLAADVGVAPSGEHVFVSNRGHDSIAIFRFDPQVGLDLVALRPCGGSGPRALAIAPGGEHLAVANRGDGAVVLLPRRGGGGDLGEPVVRLGVPQASCVVFATVPDAG